MSRVAIDARRPSFARQIYVWKVEHLKCRGAIRRRETHRLEIDF